MRFLRFATVGVSNTLVSQAAYLVLLAAATPYRVAAAAAFAAGAANGYVLNRRWTFAAHDSSAARLRYAAVQAGGLAATTALVSLLVAGGVPRGLAYVAAAPPVTVATFLANREWTFA